MRGDRRRVSRWALFLLLLLVGAPLGYYVARHHAWPAYKGWRDARLTRMAREFIRTGNYDDALLTARQGLRNNQRNQTLWRLAAQAAKAKKSPDAVYYQLNVARLDKSLDSQLDLIRLALDHNDYRDALDAIEAVDAAGQRSAEFHRLAADTYRAVNRPVAAKLHLYSLLSLRPDDNVARVDLAELELGEDAEGRNTTVRPELRRIAGVPALRARTCSLLLQDALRRNEAGAIRDGVEQLKATPNLTASQRVLVLAGLTRSDAAAAEQYRQQLQKDFADSPESAVALADYYRQYGPATEGRRWFETLPERTRTDPALQEAEANAYLAWQDWARVDQTASVGPWKDREFMRNALLAYSARRAGRFGDAGNFWRLAVIQAGESPRQTSELLLRVGQWGWQSEQYELVWKLFAQMPRNESVSRQLVTWERSQGHTANLNRIFARQLEYSADDRMLRNNFAYSSLLLDSNLPRAIEYARDNLRAEPDNPFFVTTQALALFKQNQPGEALALLERLGATDLSAPERTLFRALFRASTGDADGATDLLAGVPLGGLLPEERRLAERAGTIVAELHGEKGEGQRLLTLSNRGEIDRSKGWLKAMPDPVRTGATIEMQTSDSLFAMHDWTGLATQLRRASWGERDHLRFALTAFAARQRNDNAAAQSYWRSALAAAGGQEERLGQLEALVTPWGWQAEKMDVLLRRFERDPSEQGTFDQLMTYYRNAGRTAEMVNVLKAYLAAHPSDEKQRRGFAYYSMLSGLNVTRAYVAAQQAYQSDPGEHEGRMVYAFALWKQHRAKEAWDVLEGTRAQPGQLVPEALLRAAVLADLNRREDAQRTLAKFNAKSALPEEATLASVLASRIKDDKSVTGLN